jgi:hypothetical protein
MLRWLCSVLFDGGDKRRASDVLEQGCNGELAVSMLKATCWSSEVAKSLSNAGRGALQPRHLSGEIAMRHFLLLSSGEVEQRRVCSVLLGTYWSNLLRIGEVA